MVAPGAPNPMPITGVVIVADKTKCPLDFSPIDKAFDEPSTEADIWKDSFFAFSRVYRYVAVSKTPPRNAYVVNVLADLAIGNAGDPVPPGFVPLETTEDTREKALRKKQLSVRMVPRASAVDAVCDLIVLTRQKKPPQGYTLAGEIDGACICFKYGVIPVDFGTGPSPAQANQGSMYPGLSGGSGLPYPVHGGAGGGGGLPYPMHPGAVEAAANGGGPSRETVALSQRQDSLHSSSGIDGVPFKLHSSLRSQGSRDDGRLPALPSVDRSRLDARFLYSFAMEQQVLTSQLST